MRVQKGILRYRLYSVAVKSRECLRVIQYDSLLYVVHFPGLFTRMRGDRRSTVGLVTMMAVALGGLGAARAAGGVWQAPVYTSWQWQLQWEVDTSFDVDMYDLDLFGEPHVIVQ